jgi:hypothetical protein
MHSTRRLYIIFLNILVAMRPGEASVVASKYFTRVFSAEVGYGKTPLYYKQPLKAQALAMDS